MAQRGEKLSNEGWDVCFLLDESGPSQAQNGRLGCGGAHRSECFNQRRTLIDGHERSSRGRRDGKWTWNMQVIVLGSGPDAWRDSLLVRWWLA
jgi:hypothetical protein